MHLKSSIHFCSVRLICLSTNRYYDTTYSSSVTKYPHFCKMSSLFHLQSAKCQIHHKVLLLSGLGDTIWLLGYYWNTNIFNWQQGNGLLVTDISNCCYWGSVGETVWPFTYSSKTIFLCELLCFSVRRRADVSETSDEALHKPSSLSESE